MCIFVCVYIYIYTYVYRYIYSHLYVYVYIYMSKFFFISGISVNIYKKLLSVLVMKLPLTLLWCDGYAHGFGFRKAWDQF